MARGISGQPIALLLASALALAAQQPALQGITADALRAHLKFLSSDLLEGRATPSRGLDLAAAYIATQFQLAGLEPASAGSYFQTENTVKNVAGLLRGSDPILKDTYVILSAHYDHVGVDAKGQIYNGANDDGSGTVSVIEIARALARLRVHPKRSILFLAFSGEEKGLVGSRYYAAHPLEPIAKTVAALNLEQVGRTDATDGPQIATASITGFDFSNLPSFFTTPGVKVYKDAKMSDSLFARSDNLPLARLGIPSHTLFVAADFADYHKPGDDWEKIDYNNLVKIDQAVATAVLRLASEAPPPHWNESNPAAKRYVDAAAKLHSQ